MSPIAHIFTLSKLTDIDQRRMAIRNLILRQSRYIQLPNFVRISEHDLRTAFDAYDHYFFGSSLTDALRQSNCYPLPLKLSGRLRSAGGRTHRITSNRGQTVQYGIQISTALLFSNFRTPEETVEVTGIACSDRLDAMMRILEHEMLHLAEFLAFGESSCSGKRFQKIAANIFGHKSHMHAMITSRTRALQSTTLRPGHRVQFIHDGTRLSGIVNRINKRATVLVEHRTGVRYTNGKRYLKYYIPIGALSADTTAR